MSLEIQRGHAGDHRRGHGRASTDRQAAAWTKPVRRENSRSGSPQAYAGSEVREDRRVIVGIGGADGERERGRRRIHP